MLEKIKTIKKENLYLVLALLFGFCMVFFNPPFAGVPDEGAHFYRAWGISQGDFLACGDKINADALGLPEELKPMKMSVSGEEKVSMGKIKKALFEKDVQGLAPWSGAVCGSNPLGYLPQVLGIEVSKIFHLPVLWGFYLARLFNFLVAVFLTYFALRLLPFGKIILMVVALLPMTVQQYSSLSYDALHISMIFLFISYVLSLAISEKKLSKRELFLLGAVAILAANIKFGFIPVMLLLLIVPWKKMNGKKFYWIYMAVVLVLGIGLFLWAQKNSISTEGVRERVYPAEQFAEVLTNPIGFILVIINTLYRSIVFFFETFLYKPGWLNDSLSPVFYLGTFLGIILLIRNEKEKVSLSNYQRIILGMTFVAGIIFIFLSMYVFWSKVGGDKVQGVQGRYFIAISPLIILAFYKSKFDFRWDWVHKYFSWIIVIFFLGIFASTLGAIWSIYYDTSKAVGEYSYDKYLSKEERDSLAVFTIAKNLKQTFVASKDNLLGIKIYLQKGIYTGNINFFLKDEKCEKTLRKRSLDWTEEEVGNILINFGALYDSKNKKFCIEAELKDIRIPFKVSKDRYLEGEATADGENISEDWVFDVVYEN
ncbi:MAG: hypothetical protein UR66_C0006G0009 [Candidatus Moranbacteria bacterium GW2011_GWE1_35_17]|nr:MAG: hypothetical protein UR66_C0006G0009 [Candidatus Moranbacteria bacterium GW2011_GWE1_35_17]